MADILPYKRTLDCTLDTTVTRTTKGRDKAVQLQAWGGPDGYRRFRLSDFITFGT